MPVLHRNPGRRRVDNHLEAAGKHLEAAAEDSPPAAAGGIHLEAAAEDSPPAAEAADNHPAAAGGNHLEAAAEDSPPAAAGGSRGRVVVEGSSPEAGVADRTCDLPEISSGAYSGKQIVDMILSAIVCRLASHSGNRKPM